MKYKIIIMIILIATLVNLMVHQVSVEENKKVKSMAEEYVLQRLQDCVCADKPSFNQVMNWSVHVDGE